MKGMKKSINKSKFLTFISFNLLALFLFLQYSNIQVLAQPIDPPGLEIAMDVQKANTPDLMSDPDVVGTAVGLNEKGRPIILVFTISGQARGIPRSLEGFPVVVKVTGEIFALDHKVTHNPPGQSGGGDSEDPPPPPEEGCDSTTERCRPAYIGNSTGHPNITAGTIGCRVTDGTDVYALSNNHVYADENKASIGDYVLQPGSFDGGVDPVDAIGTLFDFEPIKFNGVNNTIDAAIALSSTSLLGNATLSDGYGIPKSTTVAASINLKVKKYGRTTGLTKGRVTAINATVNINYGTSGVARFVNQIIIEPGAFSAGGDSGSLIVVDGKGKNIADDRKPVGLPG